MGVGAFFAGLWAATLGPPVSFDVLLSNSNRYIIFIFSKQNLKSNKYVIWFAKMLK
jgi:hypothetical protein